MRPLGAISAALAVLAMLCTVGLPRAWAQPGAGGGGGTGAPAAASSLLVDATPLLGNASLAPGAWGELLVRIRNSSSAKAEGEVVVKAASLSWAVDEANQSRAPFAVAGGATVSLRIPTRIGEHDDPLLEVFDGNGKRIHEQGIRRAGGSEGLLVDVSQASALGAALRGIPIASRVDPFGMPYGRGYASGGGLAVEVSSPPYDPLTGDPVLPTHTAAYGRTAAVLLRSDVLVRMGAVELHALAGYVLAGGTLAVIVTRPEDQRHGVLTALTGGEIQPAEVDPLTLSELVLPAPATTGSWGGSVGTKSVPRAARPAPELADHLSGYSGGNLHPSRYGASAIYGLGEVHVLAFDPTRKPGVDSPWIQIRMVDLVRRGLERRSSVLFNPGGYHEITKEVRRRLDPNEGSRWAIVVAALLLCLYSVVAGPVNFAQWRKRGRPLRALLTLTVLSALTFVLVVVTGIVAKGCTGRARHLAFVEAGAGMQLGTARRWRGFFVPNSRKLTVRSTHGSSVLSTARMDYDDESQDRLVVDRDGARLADLSLRPWQTVVVREDGVVDLGDGISLRSIGPGEVEVVNHTGRNLRGLLLKLPVATQLRWHPRLDAGARIASSALSPLPAAIHSRMTAGGMSLHDFDPVGYHAELEGVSSGLGDCWQAIAGTATHDADWFPDGVPVLLAQIDGGEGRGHDSGLRIDSDRVLVRVVGFGGRP